jgi:DNA polymerase-3 subunit alpha
MQPQFIHLRLHTEFSLVDGIVRIKPLVKRLTELNIPAVAVTEYSNLFSLVKFYRATIASGIKTIVGADVYLYNSEDAKKPFLLTLLVNTQQGYITLTELISKAYQQGQHLGVPMLQESWLIENHQGLIALSGAMEGDIGQALIADNIILAQQKAQKWAALFKDSFYLELQRIGKANEEYYLKAAVELATQLNLPVVATNNVRFLHQEDFAAHEVRVCINQGQVINDDRRPKNYTDQQYLRSTEEMLDLFADIPEALANSVEIARRCNLELTLGKNYLPDFPVPKGMTLEEVFRQASKEGLNQRLQEVTPIGSGTFEENRQAYDARLQLELNVICQMGFPGYFMIVADFIQWAKKELIPVGPGRGSGAGSLVAYVLRITDLDPIEFDLLFERFLNPERVSMPDFDIDFCMERRDDVIDYVAQHYGRDKVSQIITYGSMAAKAVIRDVGRVSGHGYGFVDRLAKLIPFEIGMTLEKALLSTPELKNLYETDEEVRALFDMAKSLEGISRNAGKHAGGVVISPTKLTDFTPLYCDEEGNNLVTQFDKDDVEAVGLVKFDFLGLRTLTIIDWALKTLNAEKKKQGEPLVDITKIPRDDLKTYQDIFQTAQTTAVFQLESRGMKELISKLKPDCFDDIIALVALYRPGPLESGMVDDYIHVKHGAKAEYAHPILEPILQPTNGVILYQEQVMQIAREMAGYTLGGADMLRRAMGKKKPEEMAKQREIFTAGSIKNNIEESLATYVFDLISKFAGYGFNKSHSAAYALVAYQTAWLKAHYPAAFMAAVLSADMDNTDKVVMLVEECQQMSLTVSAPHINASEYHFTTHSPKEITYGIGAIKGIGQTAIENLIQERQKKGDFSGLYNLCKRVNLRKVNRRVLEALIKSGSLDVFNENRAGHFTELPSALRVADQHGKIVATGQNDLFGLVIHTATSDDKERYATSVDPWTESQRLEYEKLTLGFYLTGHPITPYKYEIQHFTDGNMASLLANVQRSKTKISVRVAGLALEVRTRQTKKGKNIGIAILDDQTGRVEVVAFSQTYEETRDILKKDSILIAEGNLLIDDFSGMLRLTADKIYDIEHARATFARCLSFEWHQEKMQISLSEFIIQLEAITTDYQGGNCPIIIHYFSKKARVKLQLGEKWRVFATDTLILHLQRFSSINSVVMNY